MLPWPSPTVTVMVNVPADIGGVAQERLHYAQLCDAPPERPHDTETLLHQARAERLMPGDGGLNLMGILHAEWQAGHCEVDPPTR